MINVFRFGVLKRFSRSISFAVYSHYQNAVTSQGYCLNIGTQGVQELYFCDLKLPGGSSTKWTLKSYDKGNSFTYTGPGLPAFNVIIEFNFLVQTLMMLVPKHFATILQNNTFLSAPF